MARYPTDKRIVLPVHIPFGQPDSAAKYGLHAGDDSANGSDTPVYAPASGTVTGYTWGQYHGNVVEIFDGKLYPHVFHMSRLVVSPGQQVDEGQLIGYSGATGQGVTGPHIHFGVSKVSVPNTRSFSDYVDPMQYVKSSAAALQSYQRRVGSDGVNYRKGPGRSYDIIQEFPAGDVLDFKGYVHGESVSGNDIWFIGRYSGGASWSGSFDDTSTTGLPDLTPVAPAPPQTPAPAPTPQAPATPTPNYSTRPAGAASWGIDLSSYDTEVDFKQLADAGIDFAIIRAGHVGPSYGGTTDRHDPTYQRNLVGCITAGLEVGSYWFCYYDEDPETEAERFAKAVVGYPGSLWADIEAGSGTPDRNWVRRFIDEVGVRTERRCHIYTNSAYLDEQSWLTDFLTTRDLWLANYSKDPGTSFPHEPVIHQYTETGNLPGITAGIDLNYGYIGRGDFKKLGERIVISHPSTPTEPETPTPTPLPPIEPVPVKPGWKTSEFYAALIVVLPIILKLFGVTISPDETVQLVELVTAAALGIAGVVGYILSRSRTKTEAIKAVEKVNS